jgi:hypothetical protein
MKERSEALGGEEGKIQKEGVRLYMASKERYGRKERGSRWQGSRYIIRYFLNLNLKLGKQLNDLSADRQVSQLLSLLNPPTMICISVTYCLSYDPPSCFPRGQFHP